MFVDWWRFAKYLRRWFVTNDSRLLVKFVRFVVGLVVVLVVSSISSLSLLSGESGLDAIGRPFMMDDEGL